MSDEICFKELFLQVVEHYALAPDTAAELLHRILAILASEGSAGNSS